MTPAQAVKRIREADAELQASAPRPFPLPVGGLLPLVAGTVAALDKKDWWVLGMRERAGAAARDVPLERLVDERLAAIAGEKVTVVLEQQLILGQAQEELADAPDHLEAGVGVRPGERLSRLGAAARRDRESVDDMEKLLAKTKDAEVRAALELALGTNA